MIFRPIIHYIQPARSSSSWTGTLRGEASPSLDVPGKCSSRPRSCCLIHSDAMAASHSSILAAQVRWRFISLLSDASSDKWFFICFMTKFLSVSWMARPSIAKSSPAAAMRHSTQKGLSLSLGNQQMLISFKVNVATSVELELFHFMQLELAYLHFWQ